MTTNPSNDHRQQQPDPALTIDTGEVESPDTPTQPQVFRGELILVRPLPQPAPLLHLPRATKNSDPTAIASRLGVTNAAARDHSSDVLNHWFPGYDFVGASQTTDDRRFTMLNIGAELHDHLNAIDVVDSVMGRHDLVGGQVRFSGGPPGSVEPSRVFEPGRQGIRRLRIGPLVDAVDSQWTTILNNIDHFDPAASLVCEHLGRVYGAQTNTNVYMSFGKAEGFGQHWDSHDTIIVPATGAKKWTVYEPTSLSPHRPWVSDQVSERPVWEGIVEPGMCLVIPRGWGHTVHGSDELSIHYTIGINRINVTNVVERLSVESGYHPIMRADVAYDPQAPVSSYERSIHDDPDSLRDVVGALATADLVDRSIATNRARFPLRLFPKMFDSWIAAGSGDWRGASVRMPVPAGVQLVESTSQTTRFAFNNNIVEVEPSAVDLFVALADTRSHTLAELPCADNADLQTQFLRECVRSGLVDVSF